MALKILPLLVWCAENEKTITYGQLGEEVERRRLGNRVIPLAYRHAAGRVGDALKVTAFERRRPIPPLNALVVNAVTRLPGKGCDYYLKTYLKSTIGSDLTLDQRRAMVEEITHEVWQYPHWRDLLAEYDLKPIDSIPSLKIAQKRRKPRKGGWSNEPESAAHQELKQWVAENPSILKSRISFSVGEKEWLFASADRVDVMFTHRDGSVAVEVKASNANDADLERGIYQCIKYQALLRAELKAQSQIPNGSALLVIERPLNSELRDLAALLGVNVINVGGRRRKSAKGLSI